MRVAVVGLGWVACEVWLPRLHAHPAFEVAVAVDPDPAAAELAGPLLEGVTVHRAHEDVAVADVDVAFVLTPNHTHADLAAWFLERGRAVFLEKPTCAHAQELRRLAAAARTGDGRLILSVAARHRGDVAAMARLVAAGTLGEPRLVELSWVRSRGIPAREWFASRSRAGGGVLLDLGWHLVDLVHHLLGTAPVRRATALATADFLGREGWTAVWGHDAGKAGAAADVEDQLTALVTTDGAYALMLRLAWASHEDLDRTIVALHGSDASLVLRTTFGFSPQRVAPSLILSRAGLVEEIPLPDEPLGAEYDRQLDALAAQLADPSATQASLADAGAVLEVIHACYSAAGCS